MVQIVKGSKGGGKGGESGGGGGVLTPFHASRYLKKHFMRREFKKKTSTICLVCDFLRKIEVFKNGRKNSLVTSLFCS